MEGLLTKIIAISRFQGAEVTLDLVRRVVEPMMGTRQFSLEDILQVTADYFGVKVGDLKSSAKTRKISHPRQVAMYLARRLTRTSFPEIGRAVGGKDHSTVVKGYKKVEGAVRKDPEIGDQVREVERILLEGKGPDR
jgi:chromosomal replication initiator protein